LVASSHVLKLAWKETPLPTNCDSKTLASERHAKERIGGTGRERLRKKLQAKLMGRR